MYLMTTKRGFPVATFNTDDESMAFEEFERRARKGNTLAELSDYNLYKCEKIDTSFLNELIENENNAQISEFNEEDDEDY